VPEPETAGLAVRPVAAGDAHRMGELVARPSACPTTSAAGSRRSPPAAGGTASARTTAAGSSPPARSSPPRAAGGRAWPPRIPHTRGRGAQGALLAARILVARRLGLRHVVVETGEPVGGGPGTSWRNILRAGFLPVFLRPFWRSTPA
jgi:hypothetical protein